MSRSKAEPKKTPGQIAYEEDCRRKPYYRTSTKALRRTWDQLGEHEQRSWERNPTPRDW